MQTFNPHPISEIFDSSDQYIIPRFQRKYEWGRDKEVNELWQDILASCRTGKNHYIGSIIMMPVKNQSDKFMLIDGQQRMITLTLLYRALSEFVEKEGGVDWPEICRKAYYTKDYDRRKIVRASTDEESYVKIINRKDHYTGNLDRVERCYQFFYEEIKELKEHPDDVSIASLLDTLKTRITLMPVNVDKEDPCILFESVNNTGKKLTPISMLHNYVMLKCVSVETDINEGIIQKEIDDNYWMPFSNLSEKENVLLDYLRTYLTIFVGPTPKSDIYNNAKKLIKNFPN